MTLKERDANKGYGFYKIPQDEAEYDPLGATDTQGCANCRWFQANDLRCTVVEDWPIEIFATGNSNRWEAIPSFVIEPEPMEVIIVGEREASLKATKTEGGVEYPARDFAVVPDMDKPSTWKLRLTENSAGNYTVAQVGRAITAMQPSGFRGNKVQLTAAQKKQAVSRVGSAVGKISGATDEQKTALRERLEDVKEVKIDGLFGMVQSAVKTALDNMGIGRKDAEQSPDSFTLVKGVDGSWRWFAWMSNNYRDNDNPPEILMDKAHKGFIDYLDGGGTPPELWYWHTPGTVWGTTSWWDYSNGFLSLAGTVNKGMEHVAENMAKEDALGVSHGFSYTYESKQQGLIGWYQTFEISPLPADKAANPWLGFDLILKEAKEMEFTTEKRESLVRVFGEPFVVAREAGKTQDIAALEAMGVEQKAKSDEGEQGTAKTPDPATVKVQPTPTDGKGQAQVTDDGDKQATSDAVKALSEVMTDSLKEVADSVKVLAHASVKSGETVTAIGERLDELEKSDDEKMAAMFTGKAVPKGHRATADDNNQVKDGDPVTKDLFVASEDMLGKIAEGILPQTS